jgi:1,4-dihydroxy-2-naphthoate octaprenyltransferase
MTKNMKASLIIIGVILAVIGFIGLVFNYSVMLMWVLVILGVIGILWGWMGK